MDDDGLDLQRLCDRTGVTPRTVRYYVQQGLLPSPGFGPGARYGQEHLDRLLLIRRLQKEHLPLAEIRRRLAALDPAALQAQAQTSMPAPVDTSAVSAPSTSTSPPLDSAADYVRAVLARASGTSSSPSAASSPVSAPAAGPYWTSPRSPSPSPSPSRSQWERVVLAPDIELHVRRPLSRDEGRRVERIVEAAFRILNEP